MSASVPPPPVVASSPGAHCEPSHFNTCPVLGAPELTFDKSASADGIVGLFVKLV